MQRVASGAGSRGAVRCLQSLLMMHRLPFIATTAALAAALAATTSAAGDPALQVDVHRFAGTWYEIARLPDESQTTCATDMVDRYQLRPDGTLSVTSSCRTPTGKVEQQVGHAWTVPADGNVPPLLKVSYMPRWLQWLPVRQGEFAVVMLDPDYRYAVFSGPRHQHLWLLSRTPTLPADQLGRIVDRLAAQGYPTRQLVLTRQSAAYEATGSSKAVPPFTGRPRLIVWRTATLHAA